MLDEYQSERTTLKAIIRKTGVLTRALHRIFAAHGIKIRSANEASEVGRRLNPDWRGHISRTKRLKPFVHSPEVTRIAAQKRVRLFREQPHRHSLSHMPMKPREKMLAAMLDARGIEYSFNHHSGGYWLDFYLPQLRVGIELQNTKPPCKQRDDSLTASLRLRGIFYVMVRYFREGKQHAIARLLDSLKAGQVNIESLGDARALCVRPGNGINSESAGIKFLGYWKKTN